MTMATKARPGVPPEAPPGRAANTGLSEADIPTPPVGVFVQGAIAAPPAPGVGNEQSALVVDAPTAHEGNRQDEHGGPVAGGPVAGGPVVGGPVAGGPVAGGPVGGGPPGAGDQVGGAVVGGGLVGSSLVGGGLVGGGPPGAPVTRQVTASASLAPTSWAQAPAQGPEAEPEEWEEVGTAAWDPAGVWDAEDKNELWVKGLGWGVPPETSRWAEVSRWNETYTGEGQHPFTDGPAVRVGWSAAGWSSAPPVIPGDQADAGLSRDEAAAAFVDDFTVAHTRLPVGEGDDVRAGGDVVGSGGAERGERQEQELRDEPPPPARRSLPWRELVIALAVAVIGAAVALSVTNPRVHITNSGTPTSSPTLTSAITPGVATGNGAQSAISAGHTASTVRTASGSTPVTSAPLLNQRAKALPVTPGVEDSLIKSWVATNPGGYGLSLGDVAGTVPSEVFYAVQAGTGTYWAVAEFRPSPTLQAQSATTSGKAELSQFKNSLYAFSWQAGPLWTLLGEVGTGDCPGIWVPRSVLATWHLCGL
jgi:hypothetical protein